MKVWHQAFWFWPIWTSFTLHGDVRALFRSYKENIAEFPALTGVLVRQHGRPPWRVWLVTVMADSGCLKKKFKQENQLNSKFDLIVASDWSLLRCRDSCLKAILPLTVLHSTQRLRWLMWFRNIPREHPCRAKRRHIQNPNLITALSNISIVFLTSRCNIESSGKLLYLTYSKLSSQVLQKKKYFDHAGEVIWSWRDATVWSRLTWRWRGGKWINQTEILQPGTVAPRRATKQKEYLIKTERRNRQRNFGLWIIEAFRGCSVCTGLCFMWETSWMDVDSDTEGVPRG